MTNPLQRVCILGATGSVGTSTLDVIARHPDRFEVVALTAHSRIDELFAQCVQWRPRHAAVFDAAQARTLRERLRAHGVRTEVLAPLLGKLNGKLTPADRESIERAFRLFQNKLLHSPIAALQEASKEGESRKLVEAMQKLFGLKG